VMTTWRRLVPHCGTAPSRPMCQPAARTGSPYQPQRQGLMAAMSCSREAHATLGPHDLHGADFERLAQRVAVELGQLVEE
jgi:hypothetical protein